VGEHEAMIIFDQTFQQTHGSSVVVNGDGAAVVVVKLSPSGMGTMIGMTSGP